MITRGTALAAQMTEEELTTVYAALVMRWWLEGKAGR
jgi:hypothetical protein